jgi:hypothetical protein
MNTASSAAAAFVATSVADMIAPTTPPRVAGRVLRVLAVFDSPVRDYNSDRDQMRAGL